MIGTTIGRYQVLEQIGRGGMAKVYRAYDPLFERDVAVKVMTLELMEDSNLRSRFKREAKTIAALEHPAIVPVYDYGEDENRPYIVMRLIIGGTLSMRLTEGPLSIQETASIIQRICSALDRAHKRGIVHRDLKPSNIMFDEYGEAYLADFGIARLTSSALTLTGNSVIGTPAYMSPEQIHGDIEIDSRSDIYALGVICYEMLTGELPYTGKTSAKLMMKHLLDPVPDIRQVNPDLPDGINEVVVRTMAKQPEERFTSANEVASTLANLAQQARTLAVSPNPEDQIPASVSTRPAKLDLDSTGQPVETKSDGSSTASSEEYPQTEVLVPSFLEQQAADTVLETENAASALREKQSADPLPAGGSQTRIRIIIGLGVSISVLAILVLAVLVRSGTFQASRDEEASSGGNETGRETVEASNVAMELTQPIPVAAEIEATNAAEIELTEVAEENVTATANFESTRKAGRDSTATAEAQATARAQARASETAQAIETVQAQETAVFQAEKLSIISSIQDSPPLFGPRDGAMVHDDDNLVEFVSANVNIRDFVVNASFTTDSEGSQEGNRDIGILMRASSTGYRLVVSLGGFWELSFLDKGEFALAQDGRLTNLYTDATPNVLTVYAEEDEGLFFVNDQLITELDFSDVGTAGDIVIFTGYYLGDETPGQETGYEDFAIWSIGEEETAAPLPAGTQPPASPGRSGSAGNLQQAVSDVRSDMESFGGTIDVALGEGVIDCTAVVNLYDRIFSASNLNLSGTSAAEQNALAVYHSAIATFTDGARDITQNCREYLADPENSGDIPFQQWGLARQKVNEALDILRQADQVLGT